MKPAGHHPLLFDGRHYDQRWKDLVADLAFWLRQARRFGDPVLELACGTGRVALTLAKAGFKVTGIDISESMLDRARTKTSEEGLGVVWVKADIRDFALGQKFSLIIFPFNTICHLLNLEDLEACLACVKAHLRPRSRFIVDVFHPDLRFLLRNLEERYPHAEYADPDGQGTVVVTETNWYDPAAQINRLKLYYKLPGRAEEVVEELNMRIYFPQELDALLRYNGLRVVAKYGEYDETLFGPSAPKQLIVCSKRTT